MADSRFRHKVEGWIRDEFLVQKFGERFEKRELPLGAGGTFEFDAASPDAGIVVNISTASALTRRGGKIAHGCINKVRCDMLFLTMVEATMKILAFTEPEMYEFWLAEAKLGRVPLEIRFELVKLPQVLRRQLDIEKGRASEEIQHRPTTQLHRARSARR